MIIKTALQLYDWQVSFVDLHEIAGRSTPNKFALYTHSLALKKIIDNQRPSALYDDLIENMVFNDRLNKVFMKRYDKKKVGVNSFNNRLIEVCTELPLDWLFLPNANFKIKCKRLFLS